jgi:3-methylcrotonyl-CoA carboxylase alpha subunit
VAAGFLPATGTLQWLRSPEPLDGQVRVETGVVERDSVSMYYDPMIAKLLTW